MILGNRQAVEWPRQLEGAGETHMRALMRREAVHRIAVEGARVPVSLCSVPHMQLTSVDLPEPFGPIRPSRSPRATFEM